MAETKKTYKIVVMGGGGVGKSALTIRLVAGRFENVYDPTIEDSYMKPCSLDGEDINLDILDTAGQEEFSALRDQWIRESSGFILVYSMIQKSTFEDLHTFFKLIMRIKEEELDKIAIVLAGNKCDMSDQREVTETEGQARAAEWNEQGVATKFFECSAKSCLNNEKIYYEVVRMLRDKEKGGTDTNGGDGQALCPQCNNCQCVIL